MPENIPSPEELDELKDRVIELLKDHGLFIDTCIYVNGDRYRSDEREPEGYVIDEDCDPGVYFEYVRHDGNIFAMSFEGPLNHVLNGYVRDSGGFVDEFDALFAEYGLYYEYGDAWNFSCYPL